MTWSPEDKRVRCFNCRFLHDFGDTTHQCRNENGPVAMWHFLDDQEPKECWCEAFQPDDWLEKQGDMFPTLADELASALQANKRLVELNAELQKHLKVAVSAFNLSNTPIPEAHRHAAERFNALAKPVPLNECEKLPDPDYGL